jgi:hypothetical protein
MELRDYQLTAINQGAGILQKYRLLYLAFQTRTGKTLIALNIAKGFNNVLFVTKKKAIESILHDYKLGEFTYTLTVINYESVHKVNGIFDLIILDEAHSLGAFPKPCKRVKDLQRLTVNKPIIFLSATPSPESWSQLFHQMYLSGYSPFHHNNFYKWAKDYVNITKKYIYNKEMNDYGDANKVMIWQIIKHLFLIKTQEDAGFKIEVEERVLTVQMPGNLKSIISRLMKDKVYVDDKFSIVADTAVKTMQKVHQLSSGTVIDDNGYQIISDYKSRYLSEWVNGRKVVIFYKFKSEFELLKIAFPNWTDNAFTFQSSKDLIFLGQFQSAREGIRLDSAEAIIFFNIDFSFLSYEQARNRIASFERADKAILYWLFSDIGIERRIYRALMKKEDYTLKYFNHDRISIRTEMESQGTSKRLAFD